MKTEAGQLNKFGNVLAHGLNDYKSRVMPRPIVRLQDVQIPSFDVNRHEVDFLQGRNMLIKNIAQLPDLYLRRAQQSVRRAVALLR